MMRPEPALRSTPAHAGAHVAGPIPSGRSGYWLILALAATAYAFSAVQATTDPSPWALTVQLLTVAVVLRVTEVRERVQHIAWVILALAAAATVVVGVLGTGGRGLDIVLSAASVIAFLIAPVAIIRHQVRRRGVDIEALLAAIAAYVLVGMFFTLLYNLVALLTVAPTFGSDVVDSLSTQLFFSFTTLTTTGYGNIVPVSSGVQAIAVAEAITGQLFLITAVARIMRSARRPPPGADASHEGAS